MIRIDGAVCHEAGVLSWLLWTAPDALKLPTALLEVRQPQPPTINISRSRSLTLFVQPLAIRLHCRVIRLIPSRLCSDNREQNVAN